MKFWLITDKWSVLKFYTVYALLKINKCIDNLDASGEFGHHNNIMFSKQMDKYSF